MDAGRIDLDRARREAKRRVKAAGGALKLADAQLAVARELGEDELAAARAPRGGGVRGPGGPRAAARGRGDERAARPRRGAARARPRPRARAASTPRSCSATRSACARRSRATRSWRRRPGGARDWLPLLYPCHSAFLGGDRTDGLLDCARALLDAGADPDSSWEHPEFGTLGALYGAAGVAHEPRMTALLLEAGANPDDDESVYHATETADDTCLRLLLAAGAKVEGTNAIAHCLDVERPAMLRLLLDHEPGHEVAALAAVGRLPRALAGGDPDAGGGGRRPQRMGREERAQRRTGSRGGWAGPTCASCWPSSAPAARSARSTS